MKNWTNEDAAKLAELTKRRNEAREALADAVYKFGQKTGVEPDVIASLIPVVQDFGQELHDTLAEFFTVASPVSPAPHICVYPVGGGRCMNLGCTNAMFMGGAGGGAFGADGGGRATVTVPASGSGGSALRTGPTHYVSYNGATVFVKTAEFFEGQGGLISQWGKSWMPVVTLYTGREGILEARKIGENMVKAGKLKPAA